MPRGAAEAAAEPDAPAAAARRTCGHDRQDRDRREQKQQDLVADLAWDEVERRLAGGAFAVLPIGAGAKQHGRHLPMCTDQVQAEWLSVRLSERIDALVWPTLTYGFYPAFVAYAGSASLSAPVFEAVVRELAGAIASYGPRAVLVVNTGISTIAPVERALAGLPPGVPGVHLKVYDGSRYRAAAARLVRQVHGTHADELETSKMLALAPQSVRMMRATPSPAVPPGPGPMQHADPALPNFSEGGAIGDPTLASAETGRILLDCMVDDMCASVLAAFEGTAAHTT